MIALYYDIKPKTAKNRLKDFRRRDGLVPSIPATTVRHAHLYAATRQSVTTGTCEASGAIVHNGNRNRQLGKLIRRLVNRGEQDDAILAASDDLYDLYLSNGGSCTSREMHLREAVQWIRSARKRRSE